MSFSCSNLGYDDLSVADELFNTLNWGNKTTHQYTNPSTNNSGRYLYPLGVSGQSQSYMEIAIMRGERGFPNLNDCTSVPTALYPANNVSLGGGKPC